MDGTHTNVTVGQPGNGRGVRYVADYNPASPSHTDIYSAALNTALDRTKGTINIWARVANAGVWTDGAERDIIKLEADGNNQFIINKQVANNQLRAIIIFGGTVKQQLITTSTLDLFQLGMTWDTTADEFKVYFNAVQQGGTLSGLGTWVGDLLNTRSIIGARDTVATFPWSGDIAYVSLYDEALSLSDFRAQWNAGN
jgi:hypothetical protein